ncbi:MAG: hypothetical protein IT244_11135 [Bacteroidia bacterium]|nr:hypothetical protein [Bacteroidia bacterium]
MKKNNPTPDMNEAMVRLTLENNALLKTVLHYVEKMEAARLNISIEEVEAQTDEIISNNLEQAMEIINNPDGE